MEPAAWQEVFHMFDDFENCAPLSFAIGGFLQNYGATMIGGPSGHGKTLILLSIAKALLAGKGARLGTCSQSKKTRRASYISFPSARLHLSSIG
jgi:RecA-family ATPase